MNQSVLKPIQDAVRGRISGGMLAAFGLAAFMLMGSLRAASPNFQYTEPRGGKRGTEVKVVITGQRLQDLQEIIFHEPGLSAKDILVDPKANGAKAEATIVIAPDCTLGQHHMVLRCATGFTYAKTFWVSQFDNVLEVEPNDDFAAPQDIPMNVTIEGSTKPEEVDFYRVKAKKGERISVEVEALRLNNLPNSYGMDSYAAILTSERFELAVSDDSSLLKQDSVVSAVAPKDGDYIIEIRDSAYQGNGRYRVHIGNYPRPLVVYPAGGKGGSEVEVSFIGDPLGVFKQKVKLPAKADDGYPVLAQQNGLFSPSGNTMRVSSYDNVMEVEPNNEMKDVTAPMGALPSAFNGILSAPDDIDYFKFTAKKGERYRFRAMANILGSPVDTVMYLYNDKGGALGNNDDSDGLTDSKIDFTAPADGEYFVGIRDMLKRGGEDFVYRIETESFDPTILVSMPEMVRNDFQYRKQFNVPQGSNYVMLVNVSRQNFSGDLKFEMPNLPPGVTWEADTISANLSQIPLLLKAAPNAPLGGALVPLLVKSTDPAKPGEGKFVQQLDLARGEPNGTPYYVTNYDKLPVAVSQAAPFAVSIDQPQVPLVRDGSLKLKVRAQRNGYDGKIDVRMIWNPPGVSAPALLSIPEKQNEIEYELTANATAEVRNFKITVLAEADTGNGIVTVASPFVNLSIEEPYVKMKMNMAMVNQGASGEMVCELENLRPFDGKAKIQIMALPAKATAPEVEVSKDDTSVAIPVAAADETPVGQHKNMFCTLVVTVNGQPITHRVGMGGVLRVDPKPKEPAKPAAPAAPGKPAAVAKTDAPAKPLSRLEQLRQEAQKQAAAKK